MSILVSPEGLWQYFQDNKSTLKEQYLLVADSPDEDIEVYLTEEKDFPYFQVEVDGVCEWEVSTSSKSDAEASYTNILSLYISNDLYKDDGCCEGLDDDDIDRVDEILNATEDLLRVMLEGDPYADFEFSMEEVEDIASTVGQYLNDVCGYSVRFPTVDGDTVIQYPFGDEEPTEEDDEC